MAPRESTPRAHDILELLFVSGSHRIDARLHAPQGRARGSIAIAHPHPLHGGRMDHPVVATTAERAAAAGLWALRFDFRGVGRSEGRADDMAGHLEDWRAALLEVQRRSGAGARLGAGFSYGARTLVALVDPPLDAMLLLAPATRVPQSKRDFGNLLLGRPIDEAARDSAVLRRLGAIVLPACALVGEHDAVAPPDELRAALPAHVALDVLPGLGHFFSHGAGAGALDRHLIEPAVDRALLALLSPAP